MTYATLTLRGWMVYREDGGDGYLTPIAGPLSRSAAEAFVREACPSMWLELIVTTDTYIGPA